MTKGITYLFDPLCGWCYGAGPTIREIAQNTRGFALAPTGLFAGKNAIPMAGFAEAARVHDRRIAALSDQPFTKDYFDKVLGQPNGRLDSHNATLALTAVHLTAPEQELEALTQIQLARYRDGHDISSLSVLTSVLEGHNWIKAAALLNDGRSEVQTEMATRISNARSLSRRLGARGVPTLVVQTSDGLRQVVSGDLFQPKESLLALIAAL